MSAVAAATAAVDIVITVANTANGSLIYAYLRAKITRTQYKKDT